VIRLLVGIVIGQKVDGPQSIVHMVEVGHLNWWIGGLGGLVD